jgi:5-methylcytosine-specific restriction protein B
VDGKVVGQSWENLWENHLYGLLFEYLRGLPNAKEDLEKLHRAYNLEDKY